MLVAVQTIGVDGCHTGLGGGINAEFVNWGWWADRRNQGSHGTWAWGQELRDWWWESHVLGVCVGRETSKWRWQGAFTGGSRVWARWGHKLGS